MRIAIISDIHSNLEAFQNVLRYIDRKQVDNIFCLGDSIGYGPNPIETIRLAQNFDKYIMGNHEQAVLEEPTGFNKIASKSIYWTKNQIKEKMSDDEFNTFIQKFKIRDTFNDNILLVHGSPINPMDYIVKLDRAEKALDFIKDKYRICFVGHTHKPGTFIQNHDFVRFLEPNYSPKPLIEDNITKIINVGSVGQPRDKDNRSCFVILEDNNYYFVRLEYDIDTTMDKIFAIEELPNYIGHRLRFGG